MNPLIRGLMRPEAYDHPVSAFQLLETHISWVILTGQYAYKLKKPVDLGFADFTTRDRRHHFCEEEIRLNRRLAPELYLGVRPITGSPERPSFFEPGLPIEYAVQMRQFDQSLLLPAVLQRGELRSEQIDRLAVTIADFHRTTAIAGPTSRFGMPGAVRDPAVANFDTLQAMEQTPHDVNSLRAWTESEFSRRQDWFQQRHADGWIRECHGDMHLGNMVLLDGVIRIFDCLEFNPDLRWGDVMGEIAFLVMDLQDRSRPDLGFRVLNGWLEQIGDYDGLIGFRWYLVYRAMVRAKVAALRIQQADVQATEREHKQREMMTYLSLARRWTETRRPALILMHGVSGSGKSHVAQTISERFGAIRLRSDVERKRLFGCWGAPGPTRLTGDMYAPQLTQFLYRDVLANHIIRIIESGFSVVVDATNLHRWQRTLFREVATRQNIPCRIIDVRAEPGTLRRRIKSRREGITDPSDATIAVMEDQLRTREPLTEDELQIALNVNTELRDWPNDLEAGLSTVLQT